MPLCLLFLCPGSGSILNTLHIKYQDCDGGKSGQITPLQFIAKANKFKYSRALTRIHKQMPTNEDTGMDTRAFSAVVGNIKIYVMSLIH